jgi:DNA-binding HxlR family transcriptional regulator
MAAYPADVTPDSRSSPLSAALHAVGDRWTLMLIEQLLDGPARFGELQERLGGIAPNVLSQRLGRLEAEGLVVTEPYSERPPRYVYELAAAGRELAGALRLLADWGARHRDDAEPPRHRLCGSPVEARWWCPVCERPADADLDEDLRYA